MKYHLLYTDKNNKFQNEKKYFLNFENAEKYLKKINAKYWEIGIPDDLELKIILQKVNS